MALESNANHLAALLFIALPNELAARDHPQTLFWLTTGTFPTLDSTSVCSITNKNGHHEDARNNGNSKRRDVGK